MCATHSPPTEASTVSDHSPGPHLAPAELSEREVLIVRHIAWGYSNKEIAARLRLSVKTVETYKMRAMEKLQARGRVDLVRHAVKQGWMIEEP